MNTKSYKGSFILSKLVAAVGLTLLVVVSLSFSLSAQSVNQGYKADKPLQKGLIVAVAEDDSNRVEPASRDSEDRLKGVVVQQNDSPVTLSSEGQNIFVATSGNYAVLVSDENGEIKAGDYLSLSSHAGIAMKARDDQAVVVGKANQDFNGKSGAIGSSQDSTTKTTVRFGKIEASVAIGRNPWLKESEANSVPRFLENAGATIAGKPVSTARIWMALIIFLGTAFIVGVMLYSSAKNSFISVGRNPLSKKTIIRGLFQIVLLSLIVFITGMFGVYLLLKL